MVEVLDRKKYQNGDIVLELRSGTNGNKWHMRIRVPGKNKYIRKSTYQTELPVAAMMAQEEYDKMSLRVRQHLPHQDLTYKQLYKEWLQKSPKGNTVARRKSIESSHRLYLLPFFGNICLSELTGDKCYSYWAWRSDYWTRGLGKTQRDKVPFFTEKPTPNTYFSERQNFFQVLRWGIRMGYLTKLPFMDLPEKQLPPKEIARPAFTIEEYSKIKSWILKYLLEYPLEYKPKYTNEYGQFMFRFFVQIGFATGMRPNELFSLKWKHVRVYDAVMEEGETLSGNYVRFGKPLVL